MADRRNSKRASVSNSKHGTPPTSPTQPGGTSGAQTDTKGKAEQLEAYCCQQITIPPLLPNILKAYTKGAIRTQPRDLLQWSASYFRAMANGEVPPVKDRLEYPVIEAESGLSRGLLRVLHKQLGDKPRVNAAAVKEKWRAICLNPADVDALLADSGLEPEFQWTKFLVLAAGTIGKKDVLETMKVTCEVLTDQPDGVDPYINYEVWWDLYLFVATKSDVPMKMAEAVNDFLKPLSAANYGLIGPTDFISQKCPPLF